MKELNKEQVQWLINYLNNRITRSRTAAEEHEKAGNTTLAMYEAAKAAENDCTLAYLFGLMHE